MTCFLHEEHESITTFTTHKGFFTRVYTSMLFYVTYVIGCVITVFTFDFLFRVGFLMFTQVILVRELMFTGGVAAWKFHQMSSMMFF